MDDHVHNGYIRRRHAHGYAVKLARKLRYDLTHSGGRAGLGGYHIDARGPRPSKVTVCKIQEPLVVCIGMNRAYQAFDDTKPVQHNLCDWRQAICGT